MHGNGTAAWSNLFSLLFSFLHDCFSSKLLNDPWCKYHSRLAIQVHIHRHRNFEIYNSIGDTDFTFKQEREVFFSLLSNTCKSVVYVNIGGFGSDWSAEKLF